MTTKETDNNVTEEASDSQEETQQEANADPQAISTQEAEQAKEVDNKKADNKEADSKEPKNKESKAKAAKQDEQSLLEDQRIQQIVEAAIMAADGPLTVANLTKLFKPGELDEENGSKQVREALKVLTEQAADRGVELKRVASGYRYQVRQELSAWVSRLWDEKPPRYTRALLETLSLVAYKQPVTRGDIEQVRGVAVSQNIMRTLIERDWVKVVGQREVPGRPSLYGTTKAFLDYFNLKSLDELPPLAEIKAILDPVEQQLEAQAQQFDAQQTAAKQNIDHVGSGEDDTDENQGSEDSASAAEQNANVEIESGHNDAEATVMTPQVELPPDPDQNQAAGTEDAQEGGDDQAQPSAEVVQLHGGQHQPH